MNVSNPFPIKEPILLLDEYFFGLPLFKFTAIDDLEIAE